MLNIFPRLGRSKMGDSSLSKTLCVVARIKWKDAHKNALEMAKYSAGYPPRGALEYSRQECCFGARLHACQFQHGCSVHRVHIAKIGTIIIPFTAMKSKSVSIGRILRTMPDTWKVLKQYWWWWWWWLWWWLWWWCKCIWGKWEYRERGVWFGNGRWISWPNQLKGE